METLFQQSGVIRADTLDELFALARGLSDQPLPKGKRVGIITNAGGPAILSTDACEAGGLSVPELSKATTAALSAFLPPAASLKNPVDLIASAIPDHLYKRDHHPPRLPRSRCTDYPLYVRDAWSRSRHCEGNPVRDL